MIKATETMEICGVDFEVRTREKAVVHAHDDNYGQIDLIEGIVYLNGTMSEPIRNNTLIHEWLHGVFQTYGLDSTEAQVCALSSELYRKGFRITTKPVIMPPKSTRRNRRL